MRRAPLLLALLLVAASTSCGKAGPTAEIVERRVASRPSADVLPGAKSRDRFEVQSAPMASSEDAGSDDMLDYDLPEGWKVVAPNKDRPVNLQPAGDPDASCYLSFLPGSAMGLEANVNRWRTQFGAAPLSSEEAAALPRAPLFGRDATVVEVAGTFTGMSGGTPRDGFKLLGLVLTEERGSMFLKFTGPSALVDAERERFLAFAGSLRLAGGHGTAAGNAAPMSPGPAGGEDGGGGLAWKIPAGWTQQPPRAMREVTFAVGEGGECYIARLGAAAGNLRGNLDRWRGQFALAPLTDAEFAALPKVMMLGTRTQLLELTGSFAGMGGNPVSGQALLGVAVFRAQDSLFVKFTGPEKTVHAERAHFLEFVASLEEP